MAVCLLLVQGAYPLDLLKMEGKLVLPVLDLYWVTGAGDVRKCVLLYKKLLFVILFVFYLGDEMDVIVLAINISLSS